MSLEQISYLSQIIAAAAVVASLIYAALQFRIYAKAARETRLVAASTDMQDFKRMLAQDATCARIFWDGLDDLNKLDRGELHRFNAMMSLIVTQVRYIDSFPDIAAEMNATAVWTRPGARQWWETARALYAPHMVALIDRRVAAAGTLVASAAHGQA
jgi:hypothetical protein